MDIECTVTKHEQQMGCLFSAQINYSLARKNKRKKCYLDFDDFEEVYCSQYGKLVQRVKENQIKRWRS